MATVGLGVLANTLDGSILNLAYPILTDVFDTKPSMVLWVTVAFLLVSATLALPLGTVGDMFGRKRLYIFGFIVFTFGLALTTFSQNIGQMIAFRVIQGVGTAMMLSISNALVVGAFPDMERGKALGVNGALVGFGLASGPVLGGLILDFLGWRALFWTRIPVSIVGVIAASIVLRPERGMPIKQNFDYYGTTVLMIGLSALLLLINRAPIDGMSPMVILLFGMALCGLGAFWVFEKRAPVPVFDFQLLKRRLFALAVASSLLQFMAQAAVLFLMPFYLLQGLGMQPWEAGPILMTLPITRLVISPLSGVLSDRFQSRTISTLGLIVMLFGYLLLMNLQVDSSIGSIVLGLVLAGCGGAMFLPPNNSVVMGSVSRDRLGMVSAVIPVVRQMGFSLGITLIGTVYALREVFHRSRLQDLGLEPFELSRIAVVAGYKDGFSVAVAFVAISIICSIFRGSDINLGGSMVYSRDTEPSN